MPQQPAAVAPGACMTTPLYTHAHTVPHPLGPVAHRLLCLLLHDRGPAAHPVLGDVGQGERAHRRVGCGPARGVGGCEGESGSKRAVRQPSRARHAWGSRKACLQESHFLGEVQPPKPTLTPPPAHSSTAGRQVAARLHYARGPLLPERSACSWLSRTQGPTRCWAPRLQRQRPYPPPQFTSRRQPCCCCRATTAPPSSLAPAHAQPSAGTPRHAAQGGALSGVCCIYVHSWYAAPPRPLPRFLHVQGPPPAHPHTHPPTRASGP